MALRMVGTSSTWLAEDVIFEYIITTPGYPRRVEGRKAVAELYRPYGTMIVLDRCHDLAVHHDIKTGVVVLEYASEGRVVSTGPRTPTGTSRYSRSPIARSVTGATTSTPWRSSTRSDGRHADGRRKSAAGIGAPIAKWPRPENASDNPIGNRWQNTATVRKIMVRRRSPCLASPRRTRRRRHPSRQAQRCLRRQAFVAHSWPKRRLDDWLNHAGWRRARVKSTCK